MVEQWEEIVSFCLSIASILFNMIIIFKLVEKNTIYNKIMRSIIKLECIFLYSQAFTFCIPKNSKEDKFSLFEYIVNSMTYVIQYMIYGQIKDLKSLRIKLEKLMLILYFISESVLFFLNTVLCIEMILIIKNPIGDKQNRIYSYIILSIIIAIAIVLLYLFNPNDDGLRCEYVLYFSLVLLIIFIISGAASIVYLSIHFCKERILMQTSRKIFVIKHGMYVMIYLFCFSFNLVQLTYMIILKKFFDISNESKGPLKFILLISLYVNSSVGITQFPIRIIETTLVSLYPFITHYFPSKDAQTQISNKMNNSLMMFITNNINLEVICLILYGLNSIFSNSHLINNFSSSFDDSDEVIERRISLDVSHKDFTTAKLHKIKYKKIFNNQNDITQGLFKTTTIKSGIGGNIDNVALLAGDNQSLQSESVVFSKIDHKSFQKISNQHDGIIIEYCRNIFNAIRSRDDISDESIKESLNPQNNQDFLKSLVESKGKSGSFFFFSSDHHYIIKTITSSELETINGGFLMNYYSHINNNDSLIAKIYGIFSIVINDITKIHIILMQNLVNCNSKHIKNIFDIKGSSFQRSTNLFNHQSNMSPLKDLDFLWMKRVEPDLVSFYKDAYNEIITTLKSDTKMLMSNNIMDYSLLLVIIQLPNPQDEDYLKIINLLGDKKYLAKSFKSKNNNYLYVVGIIDYLQQFNFAKKMELKAKSVIYCKESLNVSVQPAGYYAQRLVNFVKDNFNSSSRLNQLTL